MTRKPHVEYVAVKEETVVIVFEFAFAARIGFVILLEVERPMRMTKERKQNFASDGILAM
jgi:hypothetical protein